MAAEVSVVRAAHCPVPRAGLLDTPKPSAYIDPVERGGLTTRQFKRSDIVAG